MGKNLTKGRTIYLTLVVFTVLTTLAFTISEFDLIPVSAHGAWQNIVADSVAVEANGPNTTELSLMAQEPIPQVERVILGGFGWIYEDGNSALVVVSHYGLRDSTQNPDHWHVHNLTFESVNSGSYSHCILDLPDDPTAGIPINQDDIRVIIQNSKFMSALKDPPIAMSFDILPDPQKETCASGFALGIHTTEPKPEVVQEKSNGGNPNK